MRPNAARPERRTIYPNRSIRTGYSPSYKRVFRGPPMEVDRGERRDEVDEVEIGLLLEGIHRLYGYDLRGYAQASIRRRVRMLLAKSQLSDLGALQHKLLSDPLFFAEAVDGLTVRVSEMFRDPNFYST